MNPVDKEEFIKATSKDYRSVREIFYQNRQRIKLLSLTEARARKPKLEFDLEPKMKPDLGLKLGNSDPN